MECPQLRSLSKVEIYVSVVLSTGLKETWLQARDFRAPWWSQASPAHGDFETSPLKGRAASEIGSGRMFTVGQGRLYEQLTALDDFKHNMRWILISHPHTLSPFGEASFVNYSSKLRFRKVTDSGETFGEWQGQFYTEPQYAEQMESLLEGWYHAGFDGLQVSAGGKSRQFVPKKNAALGVSPLMEPNTIQEIPRSFNSGFDMALQMQNWANRKFVQKGFPQAYLAPGIPPQLPEQRGGVSRSSQPPRSSDFSQAQMSSTGFSNSISDLWNNRSFSPPSPHTAPIQDTLYQRSRSNSSTESVPGRMGQKPQRQSHRGSSNSSNAQRDALSSQLLNDRTNAQNAAPMDFQPNLRPITEDLPYGDVNMHHESHVRSTAATKQRQQSQRRRDENAPPTVSGRPAAVPCLPSQFASQLPVIFDSQSQDQTTRCGFSQAATRLPSTPSLDSNGRTNSLKSGCSSQSMGSRKASGALQQQSSKALGPRYGSHQSLNRASSQDPYCEDSSAFDKEMGDADRSSLDEQVHFMQQRHHIMHSHGDPTKGCTTPFAEPISRPAMNPFLQYNAA